MSIRKEIITGLVTALEAVKADATYPIELSKVKEFDENFLTFDNKDVPCVLINDTGNETLLVRNGSSYKKELNFFILGFVHANSKEELRKNLNDTKAFIEMFIDATAGSAIHANCQAIEYDQAESLYYQSEMDADKMMGTIAIAISLRYFTESGVF